MKRLVRFVFLASLLAGAVAAVRALRREQEPLPSPPTGPSGGPWPPLQNPSPATPTTSGTPAAPRAAPKAPPMDARPTPEPDDADTPDEVVAPEPSGVPVGADQSGPGTAASWVEPTGEGECPEGYPVKAKLSSKIFHSPGQLNYDRTTPDRCYASAEAAEADGLRAAKR